MTNFALTNHIQTMVMKGGNEKSKESAKLEKQRDQKERRKAIFDSKVRINLKKVRELIGLSQTEIAMAINWDPQSYSRIERGQVKMDVEILNRIQDKYDINPEAFFNYDKVIKEQEEAEKNRQDIVSEQLATYQTLENENKAKKQPFSFIVNIDTDDQEFIDLFKKVMKKKLSTLN